MKRKLENSIIEQAYRHYRIELYYYAISLCRDERLAEELVSDTFFKAMITYDTAVMDDKFKYWLFRVLKNQFIDIKRHENNTSAVTEKLDHSTGMPYVPDVLEQMLLNEQKKAVFNVVMKLKPESYREVIVLFYYSDFSINEIAAYLGQSEGAIKVILHRARKKLKIVLGGGNDEI
ncbi:RNA polymerase sigma factor [Fusibacter bizertensis]